MQNQVQKKNNFSVFYIILAIANFSTSIFDLVRRTIDYDFTVAEFFSSLPITVFFLLPLVAFIILSKKASETDDSEKRKMIQKFVLIYIAACFLLGIIDRILESFWDIDLPMFPFGLFYSHSWLFHITCIIKYNFYSLIIPLIYDVCFWVISIMFIKSLGKRKNSDADFIDGMGKTSTGYKFGIASIIILSIQTVLNIIIAFIMHDNMSGVSGEQAMGAAFVALILIAFKLVLDLVLLPAIPLSITGIVKCNSKEEIEQDRKNRRLGKKINTVCLVIAVAELVLIW